MEIFVHSQIIMKIIATINVFNSNLKFEQNYMLFYLKNHNY